MNVTIFALLLVLNLVMSNPAEESFGTELKTHYQFRKLPWLSCFRTSLSKEAPCCKIWNAKAQHQELRYAFDHEPTADVYLPVCENFYRTRLK
uniref:U40-Theraphotoxin-Ct1b_1 n=1 Tax=Coremiocnemis tropix TaxID=1904443 RepID=A0A482Z628_CORTR